VLASKLDQSKLDQTHLSGGAFLIPGGRMTASLYERMPTEARELGFRLGLGDLQLEEPCWGYDKSCKCSQCRDRDARKAPHGQIPRHRPHSDSHTTSPANRIAA
jgi:hypothetical protein